MRMVDLIQKKRDRQNLSKDEIDFIIDAYVNDSIPDYQMSALLMAIYFNGMRYKETADLTLAMVNSGDILDLSRIGGIKVDKHSSGGVGDKVSLIVAPLVASVGVSVAKMSGRGLGYTGGTIDKLESIEGFNVNLAYEQFIENVIQHKIAIVGHIGNLTPADSKLYALRDVTATVNSIPLIASSIMSKKIAAGADAIVLDVKVGSGAFMKSLEEATQLAVTMVQIGKSLNRRVTAIITDMSEPLGYEIGNANEVREAIAVLKGHGEDIRLIRVCLTIASYMTISAGLFSDSEIAYRELEDILSKGRAVHKFKELIIAQGGNPQVVDNPEKLPQAQCHIEVRSDEGGYVRSINAELVGISAMMLGAGRKTKTDQIDPSAGVTLRKKVGDKVSSGEVVAVIHTNTNEYSLSEEYLKKAITVGENIIDKGDVIYNIQQ